MKFLLVFGQHFREPDPVSYLRIAGDNCTQGKYRRVNLETHFEGGPDGKRKDGLDIAAAFADVSGCTAEWNVVARDVQLNWDAYFDARGGSVFWPFCRLLVARGRAILATVVHRFGIFAATCTVTKMPSYFKRNALPDRRSRIMAAGLRPAVTLVPYLSLPSACRMVVPRLIVNPGDGA
jgi:hypothetical protein